MADFDSEKKSEELTSGEEVKADSTKAASHQQETTPQEDDFVIAPHDWYILKVQVNREKSIQRRLAERVKLLGLEEYVTDILVPEEIVSVVKGGKKREVGRLLYPGYLIVNMEVNRDTWFLIRETSGIGDFTGSGDYTSNGSRVRKPVPMLPHEVQRILQTQQSNAEGAPKVQIPFKIGDRVKIKEGSFDGIEGEVTKIDDITGRVTVIITIFGRSTPVDLEYWQVEKVS
ncbi:MAG: transcription termination/antitermination protein NusG [Thermoguttaceae bacterium]|jgi:transcriptional antiterminator NusG